MLLEGLSRDDEWHDPKMAGYWIWAASCWIGSGMTCPNQIPHISGSGMGVHKLSKRPHISNSGKGVQEPYNVPIYTWFRELSERLRNVRVVCGDWTRVCGGNWQDIQGDVGIFFDPPYGVKDRSEVYDQDSTDVAVDVSAWCLERGAIPSYRIVLAGYEEHSDLLNNGWTMQGWKTVGGYGRIGKGRGMENRHREVLYLSPHCLNQKQGVLSLDPVSELKP